MKALVAIACSTLYANGDTKQLSLISNQHNNVQSPVVHTCSCHQRQADCKICCASYNGATRATPPASRRLIWCLADRCDMASLGCVTTWSARAFVHTHSSTCDGCLSSICTRACPHAFPRRTFPLLFAKIYNNVKSHACSCDTLQRAVSICSYSPFFLHWHPLHSFGIVSSAAHTQYITANCELNEWLFRQ